MRLYRRGRRRLLCLLAAAALLDVGGCNTKASSVGGPRIPYEQLLLTQSLFRSLEDAAVPIRPGDSVAVEFAWPPSHGDFSTDKLFAEAVVKSWVARQGVIIGKDSPAYRMRVLMHAFGLDKKEVFVGIPQINSGFWPIAVPELTFYSTVRHRGYSRLSMDLYDEETGRLIASPSAVDATVYHERYTLLFIISWTSTDLMPQPLN
ncbi:MAG: hypothetical protein A4E19_19995 [Nitrospira sp. SG-bin1]|nr:MAG: hypothetical protein A4E19_19995 [Nitrospira sp. SG-bin1]